MAKALIVLSTSSIPHEPEADDLFAGCPQTERMTYSRRCEFPDDWRKDATMIDFGTIPLYGEEYPIVSIGISPVGYEAVLSEEQISDLLDRAKKKNHRWKKKPLVTVDFTRRTR